VPPLLLPSAADPRLVGGVEGGGALSFGLRLLGAGAGPRLRLIGLLLPLGAEAELVLVVLIEEALQLLAPGGGEVGLQLHPLHGAGMEVRAASFLAGGVLALQSHLDPGAAEGGGLSNSL